MPNPVSAHLSPWRTEIGDLRPVRQAIRFIVTIGTGVVRICPFITLK